MLCAHTFYLNEKVRFVLRLSEDIFFKFMNAVYRFQVILTPRRGREPFGNTFVALLFANKITWASCFRRRASCLSKVEASSDKIALSVISNVLNKCWYFKNCVEHCDYSYPWEKVCLLHLKSWGPPTGLKPRLRWNFIKINRDEMCALCRVNWTNAVIDVFIDQFGFKCQ